MSVPAHIVEKFGSARKYRAFHRKKVSEALRVLDAAMLGSAYSPGYKDILSALRHLTTARDKAKVENWERKR